ncbi:hypothetical protein M513_05984 [Trichuris suis]|nr:hypothetical protein M513_13692 [Trichuris suis]KFD53070.1 hypothetical protein M513_05984 [Trichuris suis]
MLRRRSRLAEEVAHAYYKYGRFCCSHPYATLAHSLSMALFLSYPLLCARWYYPSPCVLVKTANLTYQSNADDLSWLNNDLPVAYIVQVILHTTPKDNFSTSFSPSHLMRSFFEAAFELRNRTTNLPGCCSESMLSEVWPLHASPSTSLRSTCRLLSPSGLWNHSQQVLLADRHFPNSLHSKKGTNCKGELLIGATDVPKLTDAHWHYAMTLMITGAKVDQVCQLRTALSSLAGSQPFIPLQREMESEEDGILHIYYKIKRTWFDYILLVVSYVILLFYLYACSQKIEMVKSKWALAFGAVLTVALSLLMAAGICVHFQLTRRTWLVELFPYLALVVGMENILCMTRSVVSTPTELDVRSRVAQGLGIEGWSLTKNFCTGFIVLSFGLLFSNVPEITEFCTIALVGFVADFYMQLFFYAPCLAFDLARFKATLNEGRSRSVAYDLPKYSQVVCPFKAFFGWKSSNETVTTPSTDEGRKEQKAAKEQSEVCVRVSSAESTVHLHQLPLPDCLNRMFAFRQRRYFQRVFMVIVAGWIVWFAVGIQQWVNSVVEPTHATYQPTVTTVQEEYNTDNPNWQLYRCWADFLESRVSTVNGRFVTVLPPVHLAVQLDETSVANMIRRTRAAQPVIIENGDYKKFLPSKELQIGRRISWLEVQMTVVLLLTCCLFLIVAIFIFYVCFIGGRNCSWKSPTLTSSREWKRFSLTADSARVKGDLFIIESLPLAFESLGEEYQMLHSLNDDLLLSLSSDCRLVIWNGRTGQAEYSFWLRRPVVQIKPLLRPCSSSMAHSAKNLNSEDAYVWSMTGQGELVAFGLSDGTFRLHNMNVGGNLIFENRLSNVGVTEVLMNGNRVVLARSNGFLDFLELCHSSNALNSLTCRLIRSIRAHAMLINCMQICNDFLVSGGDDRTVKVCNLSSCTIRHSLFGHNAPVISLATDPPDVAFTCCFEGVLCAWNLNEGRLLWMADDIATGSLTTVSLALSGALLIGYCSNRSLWLWSKCTGHLLSCIKPEEGQKAETDFGCLFDLPQMVLLNDNVAAIASRRGIQFWDVLSRMMLREVTIEGVSQFCPVRCLRRLGDDSVVCVVEDVIYRVPFPVVKV